MDEQTTYREFLEMVKIEFGDFLRLAETGKTVRYAALKARKKSIQLRNMLKDFRGFSLTNDKRISEILDEAKIRIKSEGII